ncbi:hypothetical protein BH10PSE8_BH10PSE8_01400 [soil metagenome]
MNDKPTRGPTEVGRVIHMMPPPKRSAAEELFHEQELKIADQFRCQNELLQANGREQNERLKEQSDQLREQGERINRLTNGVERLVAEMHGVRTGKQTEAFARVGGPNCSPDLPTVSGEAAFYYTFTATKIGDELGFHSSQIGALLGPRGLNWAGNGDYQEIGRDEGAGAKKYWHREVPKRLQEILDEGTPEKYGIVNTSIQAIFKRWTARKNAQQLLSELEAFNPQ